MIDHLKKGDMAREAERLLEAAHWLPEPLRTPEIEAADFATPASDSDAAELPAFLDDDQPRGGEEAYAVAAE